MDFVAQAKCPCCGEIMGLSLSLGLNLSCPGSPPPSVPPSTTVWSDNFAGTNGTALAAHTPTPGPGPGGYADDAPGFVIQSNKLTGSGSGQSIVSTFDPATADFTLTADYKYVSPDTSVTFLFRMLDGNNFLMLALQSDTIELDQLIGGADFSQLGVAALPLTNGTTYAVKIVVSGNHVAASVDGVQKISATANVALAAATIMQLNFLAVTPPAVSTLDNLIVTTP